MGGERASTANAFHVRLVGGLDGAVTGLSRYARSLYAALTADGMTPEVVGAHLPPLPPFVVATARRLGFDLRTFFSTYPVSLPPAAHGGITHLTTQHQASALALRWRSPQMPTPTVVTVHDLIMLAHRAEPELTGYMKPYDRWFERLVKRGLRRATWLLADSAHTRYDIVRYTGFPPERITVVPLGIDHATFQPALAPPDFLMRYGLRPEVPTVLYVGSEDPRKNLRRLLLAFARVRAAVPDAVLLKVGAPRFAAEREELLAAVDRAGLTGHVRFFDQVPDSDLAQFYAVATVFAFPSLYEGFGLPVLEAMACGTPVVCSDAASLPEVAGDAALMVAPADVDALAAALLRALTDADLRRTLRERGLARASQFTWQRTARQTVEVYRTALAAAAEAR